MNKCSNMLRAVFCFTAPKFHECPLKRDYFNRKKKYIFQPSQIFSGHVCFREGKWSCLFLLGSAGIPLNINCFSWAGVAFKYASNWKSLIFKVIVWSKQPPTPGHLTYMPKIATFEFVFFVPKRFERFAWQTLSPEDTQRFDVYIVFYSHNVYLDVPLEVRINGLDQWVITPIYPIYK